MEYDFNDIIDGLTYWILKIEPDVKLEDAIRNYWGFLISKEIDPHYDEYFMMYISMQEIRSSSNEEQKALLNVISKRKAMALFR